jgi:hypothetical protein
MKFLSLSAMLAATLVSGLADARAFVHAARIWKEGPLQWAELGRSLLFFAIGITFFLITVRFLMTLGVRTATLQTMVWFLTTIVGVAMIGGDFQRWAWVDQAVAVVVAGGLVWLMTRVGA